MIIRDANDVTPAVLSEVERTKDPRTREILTALVRHLHDFAREVRLTENEFRAGCAFIAELGKRTTEAHNEVVLLAGSLGFSTLVCLLNNGTNGQTTANLLGPFWRRESPRTENGASIVRSPTPGDPLWVTARIKDQDGNPVGDAEVDVWHSSTEGFYENQDPGQADMNLRGKFTTDKDGTIRFRTTKPAGYPIPIDGPVGALLRAQGRHNMRPGHIHFMIYKPGFKTHISQVYLNDDKNLETDVQFGVTAAVVGDYVRHDHEPAPAADVPEADVPEADVNDAWYSLDHTFTLDRGEAAWPRAPITGRAVGERPTLAVLERAP